MASHPHPHHHGDDHRHNHGPASSQRLLMALFLTTGFMTVEAIAAWWTGSLALLADAAHMLTDSASLALALFADRLARRPADGHRTYGYGRAKVLAGFVNGLTLLALSGWITIEAILRLQAPPQIIAGPMLWVACGGLGVNLLAFWVLHGGQEDDVNVRGAALHVMGDLLGSVAAISAAAVILLTGWMPIDPLLSLVVAALLLRSALRLTRECGHILLEGRPAGLDPAEVRRLLPDAVPGVVDVHHVHAWSLGDDEPALTLHVVTTPGTEPDLLIKAVRDTLQRRFGELHTTVQVEYAGCSHPPA